MAQPELITRQIDQLMTAAAGQGEWAATAHQEFLHGIGVAVRESLGTPMSLGQLSGVLVDEPHNLPSDIPCSAEMDAFDHAVEVDDDPETVADITLIARARTICSTCIVRKKCLENAESPPLLKPGMFGGKTMEERRPNWERKLEERHTVLETLYRGLGQQLLGMLQEAESPGTLPRQLVRLRTAYFPDLEEIEVEPPIVELPESLHQALADPKITGRAMMLLPINGQKVLKCWMAAVEQETDPLQYVDVELPVNHLKEAKNTVHKILTQLQEGTFDYADWAKSLASRKVQRSPLVFLGLLGEGIPDGDEAVLRELALEKLALIDDWNTRPGRRGPKKDIVSIKGILLDHYGLHGSALDIKELSERDGLSVQAITSRIGEGLTVLRTLLRTRTR